MRRKLAMLVALSALATHAAPEGLVLEHSYWQPASAEEANLLASSKAIRNQADAGQLRRAALYWFHASGEQDGGTGIASLKSAVELMAQAYQQHRNDAANTALYAMMSLSFAGRSRALFNRIRYSTRGIRAFDDAKRLEPGNVEIGALRMISTIFIPVSFRNLTASIIEDGERFLEAYASYGTADDRPIERVVLERYYPLVQTIMAESLRRRAEYDRARHFLLQIDPMEMAALREDYREIFMLWQALQRQTSKWE